eukprot:ctg_393.g197
MRGEIERVVKRQTELGLDVLVHGEPERNDMVEYFGELLDGFAFTQHGWVQARAHRLSDRPGAARRGGRPGARRHPSDSDRRAGASRGRPAQGARARCLPAVGGGRVSAGGGCGGQRHPDSHPHVLCGVQRHHRGDCGAGCGRHLHRVVALAHGAAGGVSALRVPERDRARGVRHPLAAGAQRGGDHRTGARRRSVHPGGAVVDQSGLRVEDTRLAGSEPGAHQHGHRREADARGAEIEPGVNRERKE